MIFRCPNVVSARYEETEILSVLVSSVPSMDNCPFHTLPQGTFCQREVLFGTDEQGHMIFAGAEVLNFQFTQDAVGLKGKCPAEKPCDVAEDRGSEAETISQQVKVQAGQRSRS